MILASGVAFLAGEPGAERVLLLRRTDGGGWSTPGGRIEDGESPLEAAQREAAEELGALPEYRIDPEPFARTQRDGVDYRTFAARVEREFDPVLNEEHDAFRWLPLAELEDTGAIADAAEFREADHPRDEGGKFTEGSGSSGKAAMVPYDKANPPAHLAKLKIPPAWTDVKVSSNPDAPLQVVGRDAKGREQRVYSEAFSKSQSATKFNRIAELSAKFDDIWKQNEARRTENPDHSDCARLIMQMGIRPGSDDDTGAEKQAYGATTLRGEHVVVSEHGVRLRFIGKKGVGIDLPVEDESLAEMLKARKAAAGDGKLFPKVNDRTLLEYVHGFDGGGFKTKDFRTLLGTKIAHEKVVGTTPPKDEKERKRRVMEVAKAVAAKLGNTPTVALQSYISPVVFAPWN